MFRGYFRPNYGSRTMNSFVSKKSRLTPKLLAKLRYFRLIIKIVKNQSIVSVWSHVLRFLLSSIVSLWIFVKFVISLKSSREVAGNFSNSNVETQPPMMTFKAFLGTQEDTITDEQAIKRYNEYKLEFRRQQLNEFFVAHKDEEW